MRRREQVGKKMDKRKMLKIEMQTIIVKRAKNESNNHNGVSNAIQSEEWRWRVIQ